METVSGSGGLTGRSLALLDRAEAEGFELLVTTDQCLRHQQNLAARRLSVLVPMSTSWPRIEVRAGRIVAAIERIAPGECVEVAV